MQNCRTGAEQEKKINKNVALLLYEACNINFALSV